MGKLGKLYEMDEMDEMDRVWEDEHAFGLWLKVEIAACEAWAKQGTIPWIDMKRIREGAKFDMGRFQTHYDDTKHDVVAFTRAVMDSLGAEGRWIHHGLTSSDVRDTALCLQMREASRLIIEGIGNAVFSIINTSKPSYADYWALDRARQRVDHAHEVMRVGMFSGPVGTYATVPPKIELEACKKLGLKPAPVSNQVIQRDRHAEWVGALVAVAASLERIDGGAEMRDIGSVARGYTTVALENVALWGERDISHSSTERIMLPDLSKRVWRMLGLFMRRRVGRRLEKERGVKEERSAT